MIRNCLTSALIPIVLLAACSAPAANDALWASGLKAGESLSIETRSAGCWGAPSHHRLRLEGPDPIRAQA